MTVPHSCDAASLVAGVLGQKRADWLIARIATPIERSALAANAPSRAEIAIALNLLLVDDLLRRVPTGASYVEDRHAAGSRILFDHGALRTIAFGNGQAQDGHGRFDRLLAPLGYAVNGVYPLPALKMTGYAYAHRDLPEAIPQFFVSELHVDRFSPAFQQAATRVFGTAADPINGQAKVALAALMDDRRIARDRACSLLPVLAGAFARHHERPMLTDYDLLLAESPEAAWIATEGNAFNHATDRVANVDAVAEAQRRIGRPIKDKIEVSANGGVRQTAFRADPVERAFGVPGGPDITRRVPGSFYEFITRARDPATGKLDLTFDSGNAQGIFAMTEAA
ncbi:2-oxoadipate dioxygenase/decarboxylase family protein [Sphingobium boeckii]|uniref:2-oxoadipate dioxygenase/decarboxylase n=1 Tax=Sphingobium boeckii TaxID=1082345 RepID=A0A7W9ECZ6_9SPHN|nr:DUF1338 family protein [Sphingobium boeckii]MBB5684602.1 hypothetical protein [Sphingobium boeckii]